MKATLKITKPYSMDIILEHNDGTETMEPYGDYIPMEESDDLMDSLVALQTDDPERIRHEIQKIYSGYMDGMIHHIVDDYTDIGVDEIMIIDEIYDEDLIVRKIMKMKNK